MLKPRRAYAAILLWLLGAALSCACAGRVTPDLPVWTVPPKTMLFSAWIERGGLTVPVQGGLRITPEGGRLGVMLLQGPTLGQCQYARGGMRCVPASEDAPAELALLLRRTGEAVGLAVPALTRNGHGRQVRITGSGWSFNGKEDHFCYKTDDATVQLHIGEITWP